MGRIKSKEEAEAWLRYLEQSNIKVGQKYIEELERLAERKERRVPTPEAFKIEMLLDEILFDDEEHEGIGISLGIPSNYDPNDPILKMARELEQMLLWGQTFGESTPEVEFDGIQKIPFISGRPAPVFKNEIMDIPVNHTQEENNKPTAWTPAPDEVDPRWLIPKEGDDSNEEG